MEEGERLAQYPSKSTSYSKLNPPLYSVYLFLGLNLNFYFYLVFYSVSNKTEKFRPTVAYLSTSAFCLFSSTISISISISGKNKNKIKIEQNLQIHWDLQSKECQDWENCTNFYSVLWENKLHYRCFHAFPKILNTFW